MDFRLRFQDPTSKATRYLDEEILALLVDPEVDEIDSMFAFASAQGVLSILESGAFKAYMVRKGKFRLLVGIDAITGPDALSRIRQATETFTPLFDGLVFKNEFATLFHPKLVRARRANGSGRLVVGSGNLTPGGLRSNFEAFGVLEIPAGHPAVDQEWDRFLADHSDEITSIDDDAIAQGERNRQRSNAARAATSGPGGKKKPIPLGSAALAPEEAEEPDDPEAPATGSLAAAADVDLSVNDRILIAEVPRAAGRWRQVGFNGDVAQEFFGAEPNSADRIALRQWTPGGWEAEPPRPVVLSGVNLNHRIEFRARPDVDYPDAGRPLLVLREVGVRTFDYAFILPGEPGFDELTGFAQAKPSIGRGVRRVIVTRAEALAAWPEMPL